MAVHEILDGLYQHEIRRVLEVFNRLLNPPAATNLDQEYMTVRVLLDFTSR